jgi:hypothetical protein
MIEATTQPSHETLDTAQIPLPLGVAAGSGDLGGFTLLRGKLEEGQCAECAVVHEPEMPHNQKSLFWQYSFREKHGRWPTWADALAHCAPEMREQWVTTLAEHGVIVPNK